MRSRGQDPILTGLASLYEEEEEEILDLGISRSLSTHTHTHTHTEERPPAKDTARKWPSASQEERPHSEPALTAP